MKKILIFILFFGFVGCSSVSTKDEQIGNWIYFETLKIISGTREYVAVLPYNNYYRNVLNKTNTDTYAMIVLSCSANKPIEASLKFNDLTLSNKDNLKNLKLEMFLDDKKLSNKEFDKPEFVNELINAKKMVIIKNGQNFNFNLEFSKKYTDEVVKKLKSACNLK